MHVHTYACTSVFMHVCMYMYEAIVSVGWTGASGFRLEALDRRVSVGFNLLRFRV